MVGYDSVTAVALLPGPGTAGCSPPFPEAGAPGSPGAPAATWWLTSHLQLGPGQVLRFDPLGPLVISFENEGNDLGLLKLLR